MKITYIKDLWKNYTQVKQIKINGWIKNNRNSGKSGFINLTDGTSFKNVQIVYKDDVINNFSDIGNLSIGSAIEVVGDVILTPNAQQPFEILANCIAPLAQAISNYPLQKKHHTVEFLRDIAHLRPRTNLFSAVMRIRSVLYKLLNDYFYEQGYVWVSSPAFTCTDAEGSGEAFCIEKVNGEHFFGSSGTLSGTGQLHAEAYAMAFNSVYSFGPCFRAEKSHTSRHLAEFWMLEPEIAFIDLKQLIDFMETFIKTIVARYMETCQDEIKFLNEFIDPKLIERLTDLQIHEFVRIDYTKAIEILLEAKKNTEFTNSNIVWGMDLESEHERYLCEKHFAKPTFIYNYPLILKPFYAKQNDDKKTVSAVDFLVPGIGELCGGSQREDDYDKLINRARDLNIAIEGIQWYLDLRKYGYYKSSGFGLGFERLIMYLTGVNNIKDVIPFPRAHGSIKY